VPLGTNLLRIDGHDGWVLPGKRDWTSARDP
jgi:hypothetical protein